MHFQDNVELRHTDICALKYIQTFTYVYKPFNAFVVKAPVCARVSLFALQEWYLYKKQSHTYVCLRVAF